MPSTGLPFAYLVFPAVPAAEARRAVGLLAAAAEAAPRPTVAHQHAATAPAPALLGEHGSLSMLQLHSHPSPQPLRGIAEVSVPGL